MTIDSLTRRCIPESGPSPSPARSPTSATSGGGPSTSTAFIDDVPLTTTEPSSTRPPRCPTDVEVGDRITTVGTFDSIGSLDPGETVTPYSIRLRATRSRSTSRGPTGSACTRWATPPTAATASPTAGPAPSSRSSSRPRGPCGPRWSLPMRARRPARPRRIASPAPAAGWTRSATGGSLETLVDLGAAAGVATPHLAGRPGRARGRAAPGRRQPARAALADTGEDESDPEPSEEPERVPPPGRGRRTAEDEEAAADDRGRGAAGTAWLDRLHDGAGRRARCSRCRTATSTSLPPPTSARTCAHRGPERSGEEVVAFDLPAEPVVAPPSGLLLARRPRPRAVRHRHPARRRQPPGGSHRQRSSTSTAGWSTSPTRTCRSADPAPTTRSPPWRCGSGSSPRPPYARSSSGRPTLVAVLPRAWSPDDPRRVLHGLDVDWRRPDRPRPPSTDTTELAPDEIGLSRRRAGLRARRGQLPAAEDLIEAGATLATCSRSNDVVDRQVSDEALAVALLLRPRACAERVRAPDHALAASGSSAGCRRRVPSRPAGGHAVQRHRRLRRPPSATGSTSPVTVSARGDHGCRTRGRGARDHRAGTPGAARPSQLDASAERPGVHYVRLVVTDDTGPRWAPRPRCRCAPPRSAR